MKWSIDGNVSVLRNAPSTGESFLPHLTTLVAVDSRVGRRPPSGYDWERERCRGDIRYRRRCRPVWSPMDALAYASREGGVVQPYWQRAVAQAMRASDHSRTRNGPRVHPTAHTLASEKRCRRHDRLMMLPIEATEKRVNPCARRRFSRRRSGKQREFSPDGAVSPTFERRRRNVSSYNVSVPGGKYQLSSSCADDRHGRGPSPNSFHESADLRVR